MVATTMESTSWLTATLSQLSSRHPRLSGLLFASGEGFLWSPEDGTVTLNPNDPDYQSYTLHELGHAMLGHQAFDLDINLIHIERDAWQAAKQIAGELGIDIDPELVEDSLDTYREWLHERSSCPNCDSNGIQDKPHSYVCIACGQHWTVNDGISCSLRRVKAK